MHFLKQFTCKKVSLLEIIPLQREEIETKNVTEKKSF